MRTKWFEAMRNDKVTLTDAIKLCRKEWALFYIGCDKTNKGYFRSAVFGRARRLREGISGGSERFSNTYTAFGEVHVCRYTAPPSVRSYCVP
jgi:hypothetical protein